MQLGKTGLAGSAALRRGQVRSGGGFEDVQGDGQPQPVTSFICREFRSDRLAHRPPVLFITVSHAQNEGGRPQNSRKIGGGRGASGMMKIEIAGLALWPVPTRGLHYLHDPVSIGKCQRARSVAIGWGRLAHAGDGDSSRDTEPWIARGRSEGHETDPPAMRHRAPDIRKSGLRVVEEHH
ncbi:MAG: hypothetical protein R3D56_16690, partial [Paracoccaceae bacterium]